MATMRKESWIYVGSTALTGGEILKYSSKGKVDIAGASSDKPVGVAAEACSAGNVTGQNIGVWMFTEWATIQVIASAAITAGDILAATTSGQVATVTLKATYSTTASWMLGFANEAAAAQGDVIEMICLTSILSII